MAAKLVAGDRRGGKVLVVGGFKYHKDKTCVDHLSWRCWRRRTCKARIRTRLFDLNDQTPNIRVMEGEGAAVHNHAADDVIISQTETRERLKAATMNDPTRTTKRTFDAEVAQLA